MARKVLGFQVKLPCTIRHLLFHIIDVQKYLSSGIDLIEQFNAFMAPAQRHCSHSLGFLFMVIRGLQQFQALHFVPQCLDVYYSMSFYEQYFLLQEVLSPVDLLS